MNKKYALPAVLTVALLSLAVTAQAANFADKTKPFDQYHWVTTHNSYEKINQNLAELPRQLSDGVRGFMLDLYTDKKPGFNRIKVCHKTIACYGPLGNQLKNEFIPFLKNNKSEIVTIFFETYVSRDDMQEVFNAIPELADYSFNPANFGPEKWPSPAEMAQKNNRLILMSDKREVSGNYTVGSKTVTVLFDQDWVKQNQWDTLGPAASNIYAAHNFSCPTRWTSIPLSTKAVAASTGKSWNRLFLMNQFHTVTSTIPDSGKYDNNLTYLMRRAANCGAQPNFVAINNYRNGDASAYVRTLTQGGIYLWEGESADKKRDTVCAIPSGPRTLVLPTLGCENDEAQSMTLSGITQGTRITLYDNPSGRRSDDYAVIDIKRDIGINESVLIPKFEQSRNNADYQMVFARNNNLGGKVSRIEIGRTPSNFSDASIVMYEGNGATQNIDCTIPFNRSHNVKMKSNGFGCSNDEIRSGMIMKAKAGTHFTLYGHPGGKSSQGRTDVTIKRDIRWPVVIPSFNRSYENSDVRVKASKSIDGKISFGSFNGAP
ncbi:hypothetical protein K5D34_10900 [Pseudomonas cichorii]|nr:hypothetical protein [Pseudomonas cichorii]MBX8510186.1 hypothetical protein [Pseudomonas cichorii]MBX8525267.1 hypothetical protein [Pseudomonas cichorii]MBX8547830.1 hypothetical protein [Pseudomonas cichorii]MBX8553977.1 hypothetical protein [Pseudomonas cichorii]MBX8560503.1 hypothetical protein [Pseudomonas cichorii]